MSFRHTKGPALQEFWPKTASTALTLGQLWVTSSGGLITATAGATKILGVGQTTIASTDTDYASATQIPVLVPTSVDEFEVDLTNTTTFTATFVGLQCDIDATGQYVDATASSHKQCTIMRQGSTTSKVIVKINGAYLFANAT